MSAPYRVLVTGSRDLPDDGSVGARLTEIRDRLPADRTMVVKHGRCPNGPDRYARHWVTIQQQRGALVVEDPWPARWHQHGPAAGPIRNQGMVDNGADEALAFIGPCTKPGCRKPRPHGSHGATGCADMAEAAGIPVRRWTT